MNKEKSDYLKGLLYFSSLMLCICLFFTVPDGDTLFYKFLGLFGISSGIRIGNNSTIYIYMIIPFIMGILSVKKILTYWWHYGTRFKQYTVLLRYLSVFIAVLVFLISMNLDSIYYAVISQRSGLQSVVYYSSDNIPLSYNSTGGTRTYSYDLTFENCGNNPVEFKVKLTTIYGSLPEVFIKDDDGEVKIFTLLPKQIINYKSEFSEFTESSEYSDGNGYYSIISVVLLNDNEQYNPKPIIKHPRYRN